MSNYQTLEVKRNATTYVFVTRGKATPFTAKEAEEFLTAVEVEAAKAFIPNDKRRIKMFVDDLKVGLEFCMAKYGASKAEVLREANRLAPSLKVSDA